MYSFVEVVIDQYIYKRSDSFVMKYLLFPHQFLGR